VYVCLHGTACNVTEKEKMEHNEPLFKTVFERELIISSCFKYLTIMYMLGKTTNCNCNCNLFAVHKSQSGHSPVDIDIVTYMPSNIIYIESE
jgi:hypothetical protein